ncbi:hypothetical protein AXX12_03830 [Anaerosporomusa subterranea]|uniref:Uncharacterized protein n=1 Tax=Anaerosporomusa subterranea TaxID=1794912 RepID=A0A154BTM2_ANASB|nr:hypothetical protein [Anaerosporomusa subterranea]KYZ77271.1 hypothetical protein AXX12_03830 [Anaerosporomusa subterranea]
MKMTLTHLLTLITATTALIFTLLAGISSQIPWLSLLQRITISVMFFSIIGYVVGIWLERRLPSLPPEDTKGQHFDAASEPAKDSGNFDPFTPNNFERIDRS